ncbi:magnesium transporter [Vibrio fluvialis]|nr:magnesium transporter [Vibrio fluvialis]MBY7997714.1 magnesium transporter [Vibrio fluvialis]MBY8093953.1 magnesium transporter [Vibrio fluvialis]MBY8105278.1 magnesium transporter [Vibrio fluvialis]
MTVTPIFERQPRLVLRISGFNRVRDHLTQDCFCVGDDLKVHHVIHMLRSLHVVGQLIDAVIVTSDEGTYLGLVPLSALAVAEPTLPILTLAQGSQFFVLPVAPAYQAALRLRQSPWALLPVLDEEHRVVGVLESRAAIGIIRQRLQLSPNELAGKVRSSWFRLTHFWR